MTKYCSLMVQSAIFASKLVFERPLNILSWPLISCGVIEQVCIQVASRASLVYSALAAAIACGVAGIGSVLRSSSSAHLRSSS